MDYGYMNSPSCSPEILPFPFLGERGESTSDTSSPGSPSANNMRNTLYNSNLDNSYGMLSLDGHSSPCYTPSMVGKIPVEYIGSTTLDEHDRRRRRTNASKDKENMSSMHLRRRAQNRVSQRAFRERKEKHLKGLENQLQDIHNKHHNLIQSYTRQTDEVQRLNNRIQQLTAELDLLRSSNEDTFNDALMPEKFDIVPYSMLYSGPQYYFDKYAVQMNGDNPTYGPADDPL
ncbi:hypothetical protein AJ79_08221 [Helicocarpus griseus UAMH5409]|uniref:Putative transcription factor kapC n=1 Tax=Helicocarpus griseus UAMH5409 TaxID=1447875 RepID=A0A2B7WUV4_9EURO|nr:hypothetical protein AJ79_08221 [Helicocarpus griseus UAMH5409]